jgi:hypothetical protein
MHASKKSRSLKALIIKDEIYSHGIKAIPTSHRKEESLETHQQIKDIKLIGYIL